MQDCLTSQCRQQMILDAWPEDRDRAMGLLGDLPGTVERIAAVSKLVDLYPAEVEPLCEGLPAGASRERCERAASRAHLRADLPLSGSKGDYSHLPPTERRMAVVLQRDSPLSKVVPNESACVGEADRSACLMQLALAYAESKDAPGAAALCMAIPLAGDPPDRWRSECLFGAAERRLKRDPVGGYADAVDLCTVGKLYGPYCIKHLLDLMGRMAPAADVRNPERWAEVARGAEAIRAVWKDSPAAEPMVGSLWSMATSMAILSAEEVTGDAIEYLPPEVVPHLRAAAAARMIADEGPEAHDLDGWVKAVEAALAKRADRKTGRRSHREFEAVGEIWPRNQAIWAGHTLIPYRGTARRLVVEDPHADMAICVLEALARDKSTPKALLQAGTTHPSSQVQWTAQQLIEWVSKASHGKRPPAQGQTPKPFAPW